MLLYDIIALVSRLLPVLPGSLFFALSHLFLFLPPLCSLRALVLSSPGYCSVEYSCCNRIGTVTVVHIVSDQCMGPTGMAMDRGV